MRAATGGLAALVLAVAMTGCGLGPGSGHPGADVLVTRDFGTQTLGSRASGRLPASETVMRLLEGSFSVQTRYGGGFVQSIDGLAGGQQAGRPVDWFYFVNGVLAPQGAAATRVNPGDRIWWDRHEWGATQTVPAVVGSFPEPFLHGGGGKRIPIRIDCATDAGPDCGVVAGRLAAAGVVASQAELGAPSGRDVGRVLVGTWASVSADGAAHQIDVGPAASGVYARFSAGGRELDLLDPSARVARVFGPDSGLVAATRYRDQQPTWVVTGTDSSGVDRAARRLDAATLAGHFAVAVTATGPYPAPVVAP